MDRTDKNEQFRVVVKTWWDKLFRIAFSKTGEKEMAHDMVQEVFVGVWQKWNDVPQNEEIEYYLLHALRYQVLNFYRINSRFQPQMVELNELIQNAHLRSEPEDEYPVLLEQARQAVRSLSPSLQRILHLRLEGGYSYDKIGAILDMEPGSARVLYSRALDQLRKKVATPVGVSVSIFILAQLVTIP